VFADSLLDSRWADRSRRGWTTAASFGLQAIALCGFLLLPLLYTQGLPQLQLMAALIAPAPPPAPMAPGHVRSAHEATSNVSADGKVIAPRSVPREILPVDEPSAPPPLDFAGVGVPGGTGDPTAPNGLLHSMGSGRNVIVPSPPAAIAHPVRVSRMMEGNLIHRVQPQYPTLARQARVQGVVVLRAVITCEGKIANIQVVSGPPLLVQSAMDAVLQWSYRPYCLNNEPVEVETQVTVNFTLGGG
jgi:periplasmic protein TonB